MARKFHIGISRSTSPFDILLPIAGVMPHFVAGAFDMVSLLNSKTIENEPDVHSILRAVSAALYF